MLTLSEETTRLAEQLADMEGVQADVAVRKALAEKISRQPIYADKHPANLPPHKGSSIEHLLRLGAEIAALEVVDSRPIRAIRNELNAI